MSVHSIEARIARLEEKLQKIENVDYLITTISSEDGATLEIDATSTYGYKSKIAHIATEDEFYHFFNKGIFKMILFNDFDRATFEEKRGIRVEEGSLLDRYLSGDVMYYGDPDGFQVRNIVLTDDEREARNAQGTS